MTNILAIETSTDNCSVSLSHGAEIYNFHELIPKQHTERLLGIIQQILEEGGLAFKDLDAVSVGVGPGSYTGIRLSCAVAQGIAYAHNLKGLAISSLELLAWETHKQTSSKLVISLIEASEKQVLLGESSFNCGEIETTFSLQDKDSAILKNYPLYTAFVGKGCNFFPEIKDQLLGEFPHASSLIEITNLRIKNNCLVDPESFLPIYLTNEDNWKKL